MLSMFNHMAYRFIALPNVQCTKIVPLTIDCYYLLICGMEPMHGDRGAGSKLTWT